MENPVVWIHSLRIVPDVPPSDNRVKSPLSEPEVQMHNTRTQPKNREGGRQGNLKWFFLCLCAVLVVFWSGPAVSPCLRAAFGLLCLGSCVSSLVLLAPAVFFFSFFFFRVVGAVPWTGKSFRYP